MKWIHILSYIVFYQYGCGKKQTVPTFCLFWGVEWRQLIGPPLLSHRLEYIYGTRQSGGMYYFVSSRLRFQMLIFFRRRGRTVALYLWKSSEGSNLAWLILGLGFCFWYLVWLTNFGYAIQLQIPTMYCMILIVCVIWIFFSLDIISKLI